MGAAGNVFEDCYVVILVEEKINANPAVSLEKMFGLMNDQYLPVIDRAVSVDE